MSKAVVYLSWFKILNKANQQKAEFFILVKLVFLCLQEIRELLSDYPVSIIKLTIPGPGLSATACAELEDPDMLDDWEEDRTFTLRGQCVPVTPSATEFLLCVAMLPLDYSEEQFINLVKSCGDVRRCFLMISEKTGQLSLIFIFIIHFEIPTSFFTVLSILRQI